MHSGLCMILLIKIINTQILLGRKVSGEGAYTRCKAGGEAGERIPSA